ELAIGEVHDARDAVLEGEPQRDQRIHPPDDESGQDDVDNDHAIYCESIGAEPPAVPRTPPLPACGERSDSKRNEVERRNPGEGVQGERGGGRREGGGGASARV